MNYIGSKTKLTEFIWKSILEFTNGEIGQVCDLFAGTGTIGTKFKKEGYPVINNDIQYYSYVYNFYLIECTPKNVTFKKLIKERKWKNKEDVFDFLNSLEGIAGFIYSNYSPSGNLNKDFNRTYFTDENGKKCDSIRKTIQEWSDNNLLTEPEYYYLLSCLLDSIDKVANTASVYSAYLKDFKKSALQTLKIIPLELIDSDHKNYVYQQNANVLVKNITPLIYYLDPPYNNRVYSDNYHMLETIAKYDQPEIKGKTGLRVDNYKSHYSQKKNAEQSFIDLIDNINSKYVFLSYNNEGIIPLQRIKSIMESKGEYKLYQIEYKRFKADNKREYSAETTIEYLHCLRIVKDGE